MIIGYSVWWSGKEAVCSQRALAPPSMVHSFSFLPMRVGESLWLISELGLAKFLGVMTPPPAAPESNQPPRPVRTWWQATTLIAAPLPG